MNNEPLISFIHQYVPATRQTLTTIAGQFEERVFAKNDFLLRAGKVSNEYLFLADGCMRSFTLDPGGNEVTTGFFKPRGVVFDVSSFFMRTIATENIQAITAGRGYVATYEKLNGMFHTIPEFREFGRAMLVKEFAAFKQRTLTLINKTAEERYQELCHTNKEVVRCAQLKHIASYLGITDSSLSRIRREFVQKAG